jgi:tetratricopeptide (TPR) repeat protein
LTIRGVRDGGCAAAVLLLLAAAARVVAQPAGAGAVSFPTSLSDAAQPHFLRGLAALHTFEYEDANEAFRQAQRADPSFAMAYWGEAMTYHQTLWRNEDVAAARQVLARLGSTPAARAGRAKTPKEKEWLSAIETLFGEGDATTRHRHYADAMGQMYARDPDNPEVASFYALALLGTVSRGLIGSADAHEGHMPALAGSDIQSRVAAILQRVLTSHPRHPGALHYLVHDYDDPEHAKLALDAARTLAKTAPESSHALHMPSHIFLQLGFWRDALASDRAAFAASETWVHRKKLGLAMRNYHALSWLQYELLQRGRYREARQTMADLEPLVQADGPRSLLSDLSSMRARYAIETRQWELMGAGRTFGNVNDLFAIGMSAIRLGHADVAEMSRQTLAVRAQSEQEGDLRPAIAIMERETAALTDLAAGRREQAVQTLQAAARAELQLPPPLGLPAPIKPAPELLGEVLLELGRPNEAIEPFEQTLRRNPKRSLSVLGLARAATALGRTETARARYLELMTNFDEADPDLPELEEARRVIDGPGSPQTRTTTAAMITVAVVVSAAVLLVVLRFATRDSAGRQRESPARAERRRRARERR